MSNKTRLLLCVLSALLALAVTIYPLVSNYYAEKNRSIVQSRYTETVETLDDSEKDEARQAAQEYNATLVNITDKAFSREALQKASESYNELLNVTGDGLMGYIEIPKISVDLPIYHGTDDTALEQGTGHLLGSSLPVGGTGTHAAITGHSGLAGQKMFSDLDRLEKGDVFYLHVLDETLAYKVVEINTVLPEDTSKLTVDRDRDSVTLITCTPYGVNTHRLLVRGDRIEYVPPKQDAAQTPQASEETASTWTEEYIRGICYGVLGVTAAVLVAGIIRTSAALTKLRTENVFHGETHYTGKRGRHGPDR